MAKANTTNKKAVVVTPYDGQKALFGSQGQRLIPLLSNEVCGSDRVSAFMVYMPAGRVAKMHRHEHTDIIVLVVEGFAATLVGDDLKPYLHGPGECLFVPAGQPHTGLNLSTSERLIAFEFHTDPGFNADVVPEPAYELRAAALAVELQKAFMGGTLDLPAHWDTSDHSSFHFKDVSEAELS